MDDFVSIVTDTNYIDYATKNPNKMKLLLFSEKTMTPPIFKTLSKEFRNSVDFGLVKKSASELISKFGVTEFPKVMMLKNIREYQGEFLNDQLKKPVLVEYIRKNMEQITQKEATLNKLSEVKIFSEKNYNLGYCAKEDKFSCIILVTDDVEKYKEVMASIKLNFSSDNYNFFIADKGNLDTDKIVDYSLWSYDESTKDSVEIIIVKGARERYSYYKGSDDEEA